MNELRTYQVDAAGDDDSGVYLHAGDVERIIRGMAERSRSEGPLGTITAPVADAIADAVHDWATEAAS
jgi:hypothetical protein